MNCQAREITSPVPIVFLVLHIFLLFHGDSRYKVDYRDLEPSFLPRPLRDVTQDIYGIRFVFLVTRRGWRRWLTAETDVVFGIVVVVARRLFLAHLVLDLPLLDDLSKEGKDTPVISLIGAVRSASIDLKVGANRRPTMSVKPCKMRRQSAWVRAIGLSLKRNSGCSQGRICLVWTTRLILKRTIFDTELNLKTISFIRPVLARDLRANRLDVFRSLLALRIDVATHSRI